MEHLLFICSNLLPGKSWWIKFWEYFTVSYKVYKGKSVKIFFPVLETSWSHHWKSVVFDNLTKVKEINGQHHNNSCRWECWGLWQRSASFTGCTGEAAGEMKGRGCGPSQVIWSMVKGILHSQKGWKQPREGLKWSSDSPPSMPKSHLLLQWLRTVTQELASAAALCNGLSLFELKWISWDHIGQLFFLADQHM